MTNVILPSPAQVISCFDELPGDIQAVIEELSKPFPIEEVKVRPGSVRRDGSAALCLAYADWWTGYLPRLNDQIGPNNWQIDLQPWGEHQIIARLRAFGGLIEKASSGSAKGEANGAQEAEVQAKKRVCAEGLLLGLFFYFLPKVWGKGERVGKDFYFADGEEQRCVYDMYARAGLLSRQYAGAATPRPQRANARTPRSSTPTQAAVPETANTTDAAPPARRAQIAHPPPLPPTCPPDPQRIATARAALKEAERNAGLVGRLVTAVTGKPQAPHEQMATEPQLGKIVALVVGHPATNTAIDALGRTFGLTALSATERKDQLRTTALTKRQASQLIDQLTALAKDSGAP